jgi:hypothetical protein
MRLAVLIIGLLLGPLMFLQTFVVNVLSDAGNNEETEQAAAIGVAMALLWLAACAFVLPFPMVSTLLFAVAGLFGLMAAATSEFVDLYIWGGISFALTWLSFIGWLGKRKDRRESAAERQRQLVRDERMEALLRQQASFPNFCPVCRFRNEPDARICTDCGAPLTPGAVTSPANAVLQKATFPNFCPSWKNRNEQGVKFCAECGANLSPAGATA